MPQELGAAGRPGMAALIVLLAPLLWGIAFPTLKIVMQGFGPVEVALFRVVGAAIIMAIVALVAPLPHLALRDIPLAAGIGLFGFPAYQILTNLGLQTAPAGAGSILVALVPMLATILSFWWFGERLARGAWLGLPIALVGAWTIIAGQTGSVVGWAAPSALANNGAARGFGYLVLATLAAGIYFALESKLVQAYSSRAVLSYSLWFGTLFFLPTMTTMNPDLQGAGTTALAALGFLIVFPTLVAFGVMAWGIKQISTAAATSTIYLVPVFSFIGAGILLGERPLWTDLSGGVLCVAGVWWVQRAQRSMEPRARGPQEVSLDDPVDSVTAGPPYRSTPADRTPDFRCCKEGVRRGSLARDGPG